MARQRQIELRQHLDVLANRLPHAWIDNPWRRQVGDPMRVLAAEGESGPRLHQRRVAGRNDRVVCGQAGCHPLLGQRGVQITDGLGLTRSVSSALDPHVRAPQGTRSGDTDQVRHRLTSPGGQHSPGAVARQELGDRLARDAGILEPRAQQRLVRALGPVTRREQRRGRVQVAGGELLDRHEHGSER